MANGNTITVCGTVTRDPELRFTTGGRGVCSFGLAWNDRYQKDGVWTDGDPTFFNVTVWGEMGERVAESCLKGSRLVVVGKMTMRKYENSEGESRTAWEMVADEVGASLKWSTVTITKTDRTKVDKPAATPAPAMYGAEEPF